jgi:hypothetical protein
MTAPGAVSDSMAVSAAVTCNRFLLSAQLTSVARMRSSSDVEVLISAIHTHRLVAQSGALSLPKVLLLILFR